MLVITHARPFPCPAPEQNILLFWFADRIHQGGQTEEHDPDLPRITLQEMLEDLTLDDPEVASTGHSRLAGPGSVQSEDSMMSE